MNLENSSALLATRPFFQQEYRHLATLLWEIAFLASFLNSLLQNMLTIVSLGAMCDSEDNVEARS